MTSAEILMVKARILARKAFGFPLKPEEYLSICFADRMRFLSMNEQLRGVWFHVANEGRRSRIAGALLKAMGMLPGAPDFVFVWPGGCALIELKADGTQSHAQKDFQLWAQHEGIFYFVVRSVEDGEAVLRQLGAIVD